MKKEEPGQDPTRASEGWQAKRRISGVMSRWIPVVATGANLIAAIYRLLDGHLPR